MQDKEFGNGDMGKPMTKFWSRFVVTRAVVNRAVMKWNRVVREKVRVVREKVRVVTEQFRVVIKRFRLATARVVMEKFIVVIERFRVVTGRVVLEKFQVVTGRVRMEWFKVVIKKFRVVTESCSKAILNHSLMFMLVPKKLSYQFQVCFTALSDLRLLQFSLLKEMMKLSKLHTGLA